MRKLLSLRDRSRVVPRSDSACVFTKRCLRSENAGFPDIASSHCENDVGYPLLGIQRMKQDGWGSRRHKRSRSFCCLLGRDAHKSFRKNSDSPVILPLLPAIALANPRTPGEPPLLPEIALADPQMYGEPPFGGMPPSKHHRPEHDEAHLPGFLHQLDLGETQQSEIKALVKAHRAELDAKLKNARSIGKEIHQLSFSNDYSDDKIQALLDQANAIHKQTALQKSKLDNAIFKLLTKEQQEKLQSKMAHFED